MLSMSLICTFIRMLITDITESEFETTVCIQYMLSSCFKVLMRIVQSSDIWCCVLSAYASWLLFRMKIIHHCSLVTVAFWSMHKLNICKTHVQINLQEETQLMFSYEIESCSESVCIMHMLCEYLSWWYSNALEFIIFVTVRLSKSALVRIIFNSV